jgi:alanine dehydrogenase
MTPAGTRILTRRDVAALLSLDDCIAAVDQAFRQFGEGRLPPPGVLGLHVDGGGFHVKAATIGGRRPYFVAKINANFPGNRAHHGLPTIQGVVLLSDAANGYPLALMDSIEITIQRTGAASAVAAKYLARADSSVITVCGCGSQGRVQLAAIGRVLPLARVLAHDVDEDKARAFVDDISRDGRLRAEVAGDLAAAVRQSDVVVTCTTAKQFFLRREDVRPGTFVAAVGADNEDKQELDPALFTGATVVVDVLEQCATIGDLHHALDAGVVTRADVHAELGAIAAGRAPGRASAAEITIFDSTGAAFQDLAAATVVYEKAERESVGLIVEFGASS